MSTRNYKVGLCKLCIEEPLTGVKAHMLTDALIRTSIYIDGKVKRGDYEAIAIISRDEMGFKYFGDDVLPEIRERMLGMKQTGEDVKKTSVHPFINKEIVCRNCERSFGPVEEYYIGNIYNKSLNQKESKLNEKGNSFFHFSAFENEVATLFMLINIWRCSAGKFQDWVLPKDIELKLGDALDVVLGSKDINIIIKNYQENIDKFPPFDFITGILEHKDQPLNANMTFIDNLDSPYFMLINRTVLLFTFDNKPLSIPSILDSVFDVSDIDFFDKGSGLVIKDIDNDCRLELLKTVSLREWDKMLSDGIQFYKEAFSMFIGRAPTEREVAQTVYNIHHNISDEHPASPELIYNVILVSIYHDVMRGLR